MRTLLRVLLMSGFLVAFSVASALANTPESACKQIMEYVQKGNWEAFYDSFDSDSQKVNLSSLPFMSFAVFGDGEWPKVDDKMDFRKMMIESLKKMAENSKAGPMPAGEVTSVKVSGDRATLEIVGPTGLGYKVLMKLEKGRWKIHLKEVEESPELVRLGEAMEKNDEEAMEREMNKVMSKMNKGIDFLAESELTKTVKANPNDPDSYYKRGRAYFDAKDFDRAISDFDQAIRLNKDFADAYNKRGVAYAMGKDYERALLDFNKAIEINPGFAWAYINRGNTYFSQGKTDKAIEEYSRAIEIDPQKSGGAYYSRGQLYFKSGDFDKAVPDLLNALVLSPDLKGVDKRLLSVGKPALPFLHKKLEEVNKNPALSDVEKSKAISAITSILGSLQEVKQK